MAVYQGAFSQISRINDHLFLSGYTAINKTRISELRITHIINISLEVPMVEAPGVQSSRVYIDDLPHANLGIHFDHISDKIRQIQLKNGHVLVHCMAGVSRSASVCIAYLMKYYRMSLREAHDYVKSKRSVIRPNPGFWKQLIDYERKLRGSNSVKMINHGLSGMIPDIYRDEMKNMVMINSPSSSYQPRTLSMNSRVSYLSTRPW